MIERGRTEIRTIVTIVTILLVLGLIVLMNPPVAAQDSANTADTAKQPTTSLEYYQQARELYREGPSKGPEIIALLNKALAIDSTDINVLQLKGTTHLGIGEFDEAIECFDRIIEGNESIYPGVVFMKAKALFFKKEYQEARQLLNAYWAFFNQEDAKKADEYRQLIQAIDEAIWSPAITAARELLEANVEADLTPYKLCIWDKLNQGDAAKDPKSAAFILPDYCSGEWFVVQVFHSELESHPLYTVYVSDSVTTGWVEIPAGSDFYGKTLKEQQAMIAELYQAVEP